MGCQHIQGEIGGETSETCIKIARHYSKYSAQNCNYPLGLTVFEFAY